MTPSTILAALLGAALAAAALAAPANAQQAPPALAGPPGTSAVKVLVIGTDGTRIDLVDREAARGRAPRLAGIAADGFAVPSLLAYQVPEAATISEVGWATIATGVWPAKHGINGMFINNDPRQSTKNGYPDFLTRIEQVRPQLSTFLASNWANIGLQQNGGPIFGDGIDARSAVAAPGEIDGWDRSDQQITDVVTRYLREGSPDAGFVYLGIVDEVAHLDGSANPRYLRAIRDTDRRIGEMLDAIRSRPSYLAERWLVVVTTDHGQQNLTFPSPLSHGLNSDLERMSFVAASGFALDVTPRFGDIRVVDVAPTVLARLGVPIDPAWNLDGRPFASRPDAPPPNVTAQPLRGGGARVVARALAGAPPLKSMVVRARGRSVRTTRRTPARRITLRVRSGRPVTRVDALVTDTDGITTSTRLRVRGDG